MKRNASSFGGVLGGLAICVGFIASSQLIGQEPGGSKSGDASPLVRFNATLLKLRIVDDEFVYAGKIFVPNPGETPEKVIERVPQTYTVSVPYTVTVNGKPVTRTRTETRTRLVSVTRMKGGKYESKEVSLDADAVFLTLEGEEIDRKQVLSQVHTAELLVPLITKGKEIPELWKQVLKRDTIIVQTTKPLQVD